MTMTTTLPPELWEVICHFLPMKEICRLRNLNSTFFAVALRLKYRNLSIRHYHSHKRILKPLRNKHAAQQVHSLNIETSAEIRRSDEWVFTNVNVPRPPYNWSQPLILFSTFRRRQLIKHVMKSLPPLQHLTVHFDLMVLPSYLDIVWTNSFHTLVKLHLSWTSHGSYHLANLDPAIFCPNVRSLTIDLTEQSWLRRSDIHSLDQIFQQAMDRACRLVPPTLEELHLCRRSTSFPGSKAIALPTFPQLKKFQCVGWFPETLTFTDIIPLVQINSNTLQDLCITICDQALDLSELYLGPNLRRLVLSSAIFYQHRNKLFSHLPSCPYMENFTLIGPCRMPSLPPDESTSFHERIFCSLAKQSITHLSIPITGELTPDLFVTIARTFPHISQFIVHSQDTVSIQSFRACIDIFGLLTSSVGNFPRLRFHGLDEHLAKNKNKEKEKEHTRDDIIKAFAHCVDLPLFWDKGKVSTTIRNGQ